MSQPITNPRLIVTGHAADGASVFSRDEAVETLCPFGPTRASFSTFDARAAVPASNDGVAGAAAQAAAVAVPQGPPRCPPGGATFCVTNLPPGYTVPMHRTQSLDYCVVVSGEVVMALDGGGETVVKAGEFIVQGGANHAWINRSTDVPCRIAVVMVGADKVTLGDGTVLEATVFKGPPKP